MALDQARIGEVVAGQMEALEHDYEGDEDVEIGAVITIVQVLKKEGDDEYSSNVRMRYNVGDPYTVIGLMRAAEHAHIKNALGHG
jgi:hypothetical protein